MATTSERIETIQHSKQRNRTALVVGAAMTLVATVFLFVLPEVIPIQRLKLLVLETTNEWFYGNPFRQLRFLGPAVGGFVAGYLAVDINGYHTWLTSMKYGAFAATAGVGVIYVVYAGYIAVRYVSAIATDPAIGASIPHVLDIVMVPLFFTLPLFIFALFEGLVAGGAGNGLRRLRTRI